MWDGVLLKDAQGHVVGIERVEQYCERLADALDRVHQAVKDADEKTRRDRAAKNANARLALQFNVGDLVMVAAWGNAAHVTRGSKLCPRWQGPYEIVGAISTTAYDVRLLGRPNKKAKPVYWSRMKRFAGAGFDINEKLVRTAVNDCQKFEVEEFVGWRVDDNNEVELKVRWHGFQPNDDTWESLEGLYDDVPVLVRKYLRTQQGQDERLDEAAAELD